MHNDETNKDKYKLLDEMIEQYSTERGMLIKILQKAQEIFGYLPWNVQSYIAMKLNIPVSAINGVVSFYSLFTQKKQGEYTINVCMGTACYVKGSQDVLSSIKEELGIDVGETTPDSTFTLKSTRCVGACSLAPVIVINNDIHDRLSPSEIPSIIHECNKKNKNQI